MKLERTFIVIQPDSIVKERIGKFLGAAGYQEVSPMSYRRGSLIGTLTAISPKKWQADAFIETDSEGESRTNVRLKLDVNTKGHIVLPKEVNYWLSEMEAFEWGVTNGHIQIERLNKSAGMVKRSIVKGTVVFLLAMILIGVPAGVILAMIMPRSASFGVFIGLTAGMIAARKHWGF